MDITLVVMAAGMGSRFGGLKQAQPVTDDGRGLLDFSVYDAIKAGFNKVVFILRKEIEQDFKRLVGNRIADKVKAEYVLQDTSLLPKGRTKPFGTAHAVLCCKDTVKEPFAVINADDYYGKNAYLDIYNHLTSAQAGQYSMVAYLLGNTVSANGSVTRGVCDIRQGKLVSIKETYQITQDCVSLSTGERFSPSTAVSMNIWGLTCDVFDILQTEFDCFLNTANLQSDEFTLPSVIFSAVNRGKAEVQAYQSKDKWYGITHRADLEEVRKALSRFRAQGLYPD